MILDTNALSALADGNPDIKPWLEKAVTVAIPVIVLGEYRYGILRSSRKQEYESWLEQSLSLFQILEVTAHTTFQYAKVRLQLKEKGTPIPENDVWIAALALENEMPIVSRDKHFKAIKGLSWENW